MKTNKRRGAKTIALLMRSAPSQHRRSIVLLAAAPLLRDRVVLVKDVRAHVDQVLLLHGAHLGPDISALDGGVHLRDLLEAIVGRGVLHVVDEALHRGAVWLCTAELLQREAHILVRARCAPERKLLLTH